MNAMGPSEQFASASDERMDELLRAAIPARPEPQTGADLCAIAMRRAAAATRDAANAAALSDIRLRKLTRQRRVANLVGLAAMLMIAILCAKAVWHWSSQGYFSALTTSSTASSSTAVDSATADETGSNNSSTLLAATTSTYGVLVACSAGGLLLTFLVLMNLPRGLASGPWSAEVAGGFF